MLDSLDQLRRSRSGRLCLGIVTLFGLGFGGLVCRTFVMPPDPKHSLDFAAAQWIEARDDSPSAYFRKEIYLTQPPKQAWLQVAATDSFEAVVNDAFLGAKTLVSQRGTGLFDLKLRLQPGKNSVAVRVSRSSYPGAAQLLARLVIREHGENIREIVSDESWKAAVNTSMVPAGLSWSAWHLDDSNWASAARATVSARFLTIEQVSLNPLLLQRQPRAGWIAAPASTASEITFLKRLELKRRPRESWLQIAATGSYDLVVNGRIAATQTAPDAFGTMLAASSATSPAPVSTPAEFDSLPIEPNAAIAETVRLPKRDPFSPPPAAMPVLDAFCITPWLRSGTNEIAVHLRPARAEAALLAEGLVVAPDGSLTDFISDGTWVSQAAGVSEDSRLSPQAASVVAAYGAPPWGTLKQRQGRTLAASLDAGQILEIVCAMLGVLAGVLLCWLGAGALAARTTGLTLEHALMRDALLHAPLVGLLAILWLANFEVRLPEYWCYQPRVAGGVLLVFALVRLLHFVPRTHVPAASAVPRSAVERGGPGHAVAMVLLVAIITLGFGLRYHNLGEMSLDHDEMALIRKAPGVLAKGYPHDVIDGEIRTQHTYELVPYFLALSGWICGWSDWAMRLPSCFFGTITIGLVAWFGRRLWDWRVGLAAALLYACLPLNIRWAQNAFYPQQAQFFALLTFWLFYEAMREHPVRKAFLSAATVAFCFCYFSWEPSALLLIALGAGLLAVRPGDWSWMKEPHLYRCLFFCAAIVLAQLCFRRLATDPYLYLVSNLSQVDGPSLVFLDPGYEPLYYVKNLLLGENHVIFTIVAVAGVPFCWRHPGVRYVAALLITLLALYTNFLPAYAPRYFYYYQPLLLISAVAVAIHLVDGMRAAGNRVTVPGVARFSGAVILMVFFLSSNALIARTWRLSSAPDRPGFTTRMGVYRIDYREAARFVKANLRPGDVVIPRMPHLYEFYAGVPGHYFLNSQLGARIKYSERSGGGRYVDKFAGYPSLGSLGDLEDVVNRSGRTWVVFALYGGARRINSPEVLEYLDRYSRIMFESYDARVLLLEGAGPLQTSR